MPHEVDNETEAPESLHSAMLTNLNAGVMSVWPPHFLVSSPETVWSLYKLNSSLYIFIACGIVFHKHVFNTAICCMLSNSPSKPQTSCFFVFFSSCLLLTSFLPLDNSISALVSSICTWFYVSVQNLGNAYERKYEICLSGTRLVGLIWSKELSSLKLWKVPLCHNFLLFNPWFASVT